jgi:hypothetical protein
MQITDVTVSDGCLRITCAGPFGIGSLGNPSGLALQQALEAALSREATSIEEVVIDFTRVHYEWGDGPGWAVFPAIRRGFRITYLAGAENHEALAGLMSATRFDRWVAVEAKRP